MKNQALISLGIPAQQSLLAASIAFLLITGATQFLAQKRTAANNLKIFNNFASHKERTVLNTVQELAKDKKFIKTNDIVKSVRKRTRKEVNLKTVLRILNTLEEHGLIKKAVVSEANTPSVCWKV
jgi:hypothetical protein